VKGVFQIKLIKSYLRSTMSQQKRLNEKLIMII